MKFTFDIPVVSDEALEKWKHCLRADVLQNGGTASTIVRRRDGEAFVRIIADSQTIIVEELTELEVLIDQAVFMSDL